MSTIDRFPGIRKAALEVAYDNGMINRFCPEDAWLRSLDNVLEAFTLTREPGALQACDEWLESLGDDELNEFCCGGADEPEQQRLIASSPWGAVADALLNDIFEAEHA